MKNLILALALAVPAGALADIVTETVTVRTAVGEVAAPVAPETVVALDLAAIDSLAALGVPVAGRPDMTPPAYLAKAVEGVPTVGTLFEPDFEALAVMAPDLIVAGGRSQPQVAALSRIAPTLDMTVGTQDLVEEAKARLDAYGAIFDRAEQARDLKDDLDAALDETRTAVGDKGNALILLVSGTKISAYGAGSRFGWLHDRLDLPQAVPDLREGNHGEAVSFEFLAKADPDWLLVIDRGAAIGQGGEAAGLRVGGIGLQGDLDVAARREQRPGASDDGRDGGRVHQRRRAAPEEDRGQPAGTRQRRLRLQVGQDRLGQRRLLLAPAPVAHHVEVAVRADARTVGPVDIEADVRPRIEGISQSAPPSAS